MHTWEVAPEPVPTVPVPPQLAAQAPASAGPRLQARAGAGLGGGGGAPTSAQPPVALAAAEPGATPLSTSGSVCWRPSRALRPYQARAPVRRLAGIVKEGME
ncbi:hypothetical protein U9M48_022852 [Paspalum notatum var. saurae]|uniref:Uncharacterized protein n=1 Tax=Paspalum notatum var. saurae TaxID=547442 RepID=A0AAQ3WUG6_PASNO